MRQPSPAGVAPAALVRYYYPPEGAGRDTSGPCLLSDWAALLDVSAEGAVLLLARAREPGSLLLLELPDPGHGNGHSRLARVVDGAPRSDRRWAVNCRFTEPLAEAELAALRQGLGPQPAPPPR